MEFCKIPDLLPVTTFRTKQREFSKQPFCYNGEMALLRLHRYSNLSNKESHRGGLKRTANQLPFLLPSFQLQESKAQILGRASTQTHQLPH